jgi:hypothetical protein
MILIIIFGAYTLTIMLILLVLWVLRSDYSAITLIRVYSYFDEMFPAEDPYKESKMKYHAKYVEE